MRPGGARPNAEPISVNEWATVKPVTIASSWPHAAQRNDQAEQEQQWSSPVADVRDAETDEAARRASRRSD